MAVNQLPLAGKPLGEEQQSRKKTLILIGASCVAAIAIGSATTMILLNSGASRHDRLAAKSFGFGGSGAAANPARQPGAPGNTFGERGREGRGGDGRGGEGRGGGGAQMMARMTTQFGLTPAQQTQIQAMQQAQRPQMQAIWSDNAMSREDKRARMTQIREQEQAQMRALLTPDQQVKFDAWQSQRQERRAEMQQRRQETRANVLASGQQIPTRGGGPGGGGGRRGGGGFGGGGFGGM